MDLSSNNTKSYNESDSLAKFSRQFMNCELINKVNSRVGMNANSQISFASKYEQCMIYLARLQNKSVTLYNFDFLPYNLNEAYMNQIRISFISFLVAVQLVVLAHII